MILIIYIYLEIQVGIYLQIVILQIYDLIIILQINRTLILLLYLTGDVYRSNTSLTSTLNNYAVLNDPVFGDSAI